VDRRLGGNQNLYGYGNEDKKAKKGVAYFKVRTDEAPVDNH
jgi:hypothetical protein